VSKPNPICVLCGVMMKCSHNGVVVADPAVEGIPSTYWHGDAYQCPSCLFTVVTGFGRGRTVVEPGAAVINFVYNDVDAIKPCKTYTPHEARGLSSFELVTALEEHAVRYVRGIPVLRSGSSDVVVNSFPTLSEEMTRRLELLEQLERVIAEVVNKTTPPLKVLKADGTIEQVGGFYISLWHGRNTPNEELDDWGFDGPVFGPYQAVQVTYARRIKLLRGDDVYHELPIVEDMAVYDDKYYGDWNIIPSADVLNDEHLKGRVVAFEEGKA